MLVIKISLEPGAYYQYYLFRKTIQSSDKQEWRFAGYLDSSYQQYGSPDHSIVALDDRAFFVIRELWGRGSGINLNGNRWFWIRDSGVKEVLNYPINGHQSSFDGSLGREFESIPLGYGSVNENYTMKVLFRVSYNFGSTPQQRLFSKDQLAYFVWDSKVNRLVLDKSSSQITEEEIESVYNIDSLSDKEFLRYNIRELLEIAGQGTVEQKGWLTKFLDGLEDSHNKAALQKALRQ